MSGKKPMLELIVTHHDEPWETGRLFFDMIEHQRGVDLSDVRITLVQDGVDGALKWEKFLDGYSFRVQVCTVPHGGPAAARNYGLEHAVADWVMFCDFDDCFADVCSLQMILVQLPVEDYDVIWGKNLKECVWRGGEIYINRVDEANFVSTDCKLYRRKFLEENGIRFDGNASLHYEMSFNAMALACTQPFRVVMLETEFYLYLKTHRADGIRHTMDGIRELAASRWNRDLSLAQWFLDHNLLYDYKKTVAKIVCVEYYRVNNYEEMPNPPKTSRAFLEFYRAHRDSLREMSPTDIDVVKDFAEAETMGMIQGFFNEYKWEYYFVNDMPFGEWLEKLDAAVDCPGFEAEERDGHGGADGGDGGGYGGENGGEEGADGTDVTAGKCVVIQNEPVLLRGDEYRLTPAEDETGGDGKRETKCAADGAVCDRPKPEPRVAVYCGTYNTYMDMLTSAKSLLWHTRMDKVYFLIEDDKFPYELPDNGMIECINVSGQKWFPEDGPNYNNSWSYMCMMRAAFTKIIPYDKVLSLDIDVVVQEDIGCLWDDIDMTECYLAGVAEPKRKKVPSDPLYINFGVVMMNLKKLRDDGTDDAVIDDLNRNRFMCPEQDAFNKHCRGHIYQMKNDYNATVHSHITGEAERERIVHFAGIKFWRHFGQVKAYSFMDWGNIMEKQERLRVEDGLLRARRRDSSEDRVTGGGDEGRKWWPGR